MGEVVTFLTRLAIYGASIALIPSIGAALVVGLVVDRAIANGVARWAESRGRLVLAVRRDDGSWRFIYGEPSDLRDPWGRA